MTSSHDRKHVDHCLNCGSPTPEAFCPMCGQEAIDAAVTFRDQLSHFFEEAIGVESRLPRTLALLFTRPGELTRAYNAGHRVRFVTPLKLYLFASVAFFLVLTFSAARGKTQVVSMNGKASAQDRAIAAATGEPLETWQTAEEFDEWSKKPESAASQIPPFFRPHIRSLLKSPEGFAGALLDMMSKASMALVPIHALILKLLYWRPRRFYGEHIVFSLHLHAFAYSVFALSMLLGLVASAGVSSASDTLVMLGGGIYSVAAARTAYAEGVWRPLFKMTVAGFGYFLALMAVVSVAAGVTFLLN